MIIKDICAGIFIGFDQQYGFGLNATQERLDFVARLSRHSTRYMERYIMPERNTMGIKGADRLSALIERSAGVHCFYNDGRLEMLYGLVFNFETAKPWFLYTEFFEQHLAHEEEVINELLDYVQKVKHDLESVLFPERCVGNTAYDLHVARYLRKLGFTTHCGLHNIEFWLGYYYPPPLSQRGVR